MSLSLLGIELSNLLARPEMITSLILVVVGSALAILAKRITKTVRKSNDVSQDDKVLLTLKIIGLVLILFGFILMMFATVA